MKTFKLSFFIIIFVLSFPLFSESQNNDSKNPLSTYENLEIPICSTHHETHEIHEYLAFTLCYCEEAEQAEWVAYELTKEELTKNASRKNNFREDENISTGSATLEDYRGSGYDRGHMAPAADMVWSEDVMSESFYISNMSPQHPSLNRGMWSKLESLGRTYADEYSSVYIVTGPILENKDYSTIGINKVIVPESYYKIFVYYNPTTETIEQEGYLMQNKKLDGELNDYKVSIESLETITGIDFFPLLNEK